jgi:hypothetical protein
LTRNWSTDFTGRADRRFGKGARLLRFVHSTAPLKQADGLWGVSPAGSGGCL